jgi:hypothetical protein
VSDFADIISAMDDSVADVLGVLIIYTTADGVEVGPLVAIAGTSAHAIDGGAGAAIEYQSRDYLVKARELVDDGGNQIEPASGDQITEVDTGVSALVKLPSADDPVWRWADVARVRRRIHAKQTGDGS